MKKVLAFDVYGTLIDTNGVAPYVSQMIGAKGLALAHTWREKQLEYAFRRGLMRTYTNFDICTQHALNYACEYHHTVLSQSQRDALLNYYKKLPAFEDVKESLQKLRADDYQLYAFSNGTATSVVELLVNAGLNELFNGVVSCDEIQSFKPNPDVYNHLLKKVNANRHNSFLVSSNSFDVIGAISAGMRAVWIQRSNKAIFDPWDIPPTITVNDFNQLSSSLKRAVW